jgi:hypothetical protein
LFAPYSTSTTCDICLVLDLRRLDPGEENTIAWTIYDNYNFGCSCLFLDGLGESFLAGTNASTGFTYQLETGYTDDGTSIEAYAFTKYFDIGSFIHPKKGEQLLVTGRGSEDYSFTVRAFLLYKNTETQKTYDFSGGGVVSGDDVLWDDIVFDDVLFDADGGYTNVVSDIFHTAYMTTPFHKIKIKIENVNANNQFYLYGFQIMGYILDYFPVG